LSGTDYQESGALTNGFRHGLWLCAGLLIVGGLVSWFGLRPDLLDGSTGPVTPSALEDFDGLDPETMGS
jgi:hypothetical protein